MKSRLIIFWVKLTNWEYWPWYIVYIPVYVYWLWCGLKTRAIFWISAVNPGFEYGGILGASKKVILDKLPTAYVPDTLLVYHSTPLPEVNRILQAKKLSFPVIIKPDIGERGFNIALIDNEDELKQYWERTNEDHLIQEYLDMPVELGVFYYRFPDKDRGVISSIVMKGMLIVTGDGVSTIEQLMQGSSRAAQQIERLKAEGKIGFSTIPTKGEQVLLEPIGNHIRGTTFLDANYLINEDLVSIFNDLALKMEGFYYGRFDIRCESVKELYKGNFKIMEVNGAASEPGHIYSPNYPILQGYRDLLFHWRTLYKISTMNHKNGVPYMSFKEGLVALRKSRFNRS